MSEANVPVEGKGVSPVAALIIVICTLVAIVAGGYGLGKFYFWKEDTRTPLERDIEQAEKDVQKKPNDISLRVKLGVLYAGAEKFELAEKEFNNALKIKPKDEDATYQIAKLNAQTGKYKEAEQQFRDILKKHPKFVPGHEMLSFVLEKQGKFKEAADELFTVDQVSNPRDSAVIFHLAQLYEKAGEKDKAIKTYEEALRYNPNSKPVKDALERLKK